MEDREGQWRIPEEPLVLGARNFLHFKLQLGPGAGVEDHDDLDENADPDTKLQLTEQTDKKAGKPRNEINLWMEEIRGVTVIMLYSLLLLQMGLMM